MGIFSRKKPQVEDRLSTSRSLFWGGSSSGTFVNETTAMQTAAVYACVRVISEAIASLPLHVYRHEKNGAHIAVDHHLYKLLHYAPNPEMTSFIFFETLMSHLLIWGNAYAQILRDGGGQVVELYPLLPNKMDVGRGDNGKLYYTYWRDMDERRPSEKSGGIAFRRDEVLHIPGLSFDGLVGYSPIALAKNAVGMAIATEDYGASFFQNGASPAGILDHPATIGKNPERVRDAWETIHKGAKNSNKIAILEDGLKFHQISIPPHMIGDLEKSSFNNIEQQSMEFVRYTLEPWVVRWEQCMHQSLVLPSEQSRIFIRFNMDGLLRGDYKTRMEGYAIGLQNGWLSPNDIRRLENQNLIPEEEGGDFYMVNGNMVRLRDVGAAYGKGKDDG